MKTFYLWDETGAPAGAVDCDEDGPLPARCTPTEPPAADAGCRVVWRGGWVQEPLPAPNLTAVKEQLRAAATASRWSHETGGITVGGIRVLTGIYDQNRIATTLIGAPATLDFKAESGWVTLTLAELQAIDDAITAHVQACFTAERSHHEAIAALETAEQAQEYDITAGWPE